MEHLGKLQDGHAIPETVEMGDRAPNRADQRRRQKAQLPDATDTTTPPA